MTSSVNLLEETIEMLKHSDQKVKNIEWIGSEITNHRMTWDEFKQLANQKYDNHTTKFQVACDLTIVFKDGNWLERVHDSKWERWRYRCRPTKAKGRDKKIKVLFGKDQSLEQINNG